MIEDAVAGRLAQNFGAHPLRPIFTAGFRPDFGLGPVLCMEMRIQGPRGPRQADCYITKRLLEYEAGKKVGPRKSDLLEFLGALTGQASYEERFQAAAAKFAADHAETEFRRLLRNEEGSLFGVRARPTPGGDGQP